MIIIGLILLVIGIGGIVFIAHESEELERAVIGITVSLSLLILEGIIVICGSFISDKPTALEVYQGKTELEITYRDSIPVDTVVIFKKEYIK